MDSQSDCELKSVKNTAPHLPSLALLPNLTNPVQGDSSTQVKGGNSRDDKVKLPSNKYRARKKKKDDKGGSKFIHLHWLTCGCLPKHRAEISEIQANAAIDSPYQDKYVLPSEYSPPISANNNMPPELPPNHTSESEELVSSGEVDNSRRRTPRRSPFERLRAFFQKRRRKSEPTLAVSTAGSPDSTTSKPAEGPKVTLSEDESSHTLLGPQKESDRGKKCFIIDLDETLVHSSFKAVDGADFKLGVEIDNVVHQVYVLKRPYVDEFLKAMANIFECVLFTASLSKYADPVADFLDKWHVFRYRLFREACVLHRGNYVKDLSQLGRPIEQVVILDNSPASYMFHASNAVQITSWYDDKSDRALLELIPYFQRLAQGDPGNVMEFLRTNPPPAQYAAVGSLDTLPPPTASTSDAAAAAAPLLITSPAPSPTLWSIALRSAKASPSPSSTASANPITSVPKRSPSGSFCKSSSTSSSSSASSSTTSATVTSTAGPSNSSRVNDSEGNDSNSLNQKSSTAAATATTTSPSSSSTSSTPERARK